MGYTLNPRWQVIEIVQSAQNEIVIDSVAGDISLSTISTPAFTGNLRQAHLIFSVQEVRNTNAGINQINGAQYIQLRDASLVYRNAILVPSGTFYFTAADILGGTFEYYGSDISTYITPSSTYLLRWEDADASADSLILYGTQMKMRLYIE